MRTVLLVLNALILGGCLALVLVWRLLTRMLAAVEPNGPDTGKGFSAEHVWETLYPLFELYGIGLVVMLVASAGYGLWGGLRAARRSPGKPPRGEAGT
jgi:hypothetical protein